MKLKRIAIVVTVLALGVALAAAPAWAMKQIKVTYETFDNDGTTCVQANPTIDKKSLPIEKLGQKIRWHLKKTTGDDAGGIWEINKLIGSNKSVDLCGENIVFSGDKADCDIAPNLRYSYDLTWNKTGCDEVIADPVIIFEGGGGDTKLPIFTLPILLSVGAAAAVAFAAGMSFGRKRRA